MEQINFDLKKLKKNYINSHIEKPKKEKIEKIENKSALNVEILTQHIGVTCDSC